MKGTNIAAFAIALPALALSGYACKVYPKANGNIYPTVEKEWVL
ncbi:hypothetical protein [Vibrio alfacsensis]